MNNKLTKQDILDMIAKSRQESEERSKKFNEDLTKSSKKFYEELAKSRKEWKGQMKELNKNIGGIGNSNGDVAEDFFYNGLEDKMKVGNISFGFIDRNVRRKIKSLNLEEEYDIILTNSDTVLITETKYKAQPDHVDELLNKKIPNFKKLFPIYKEFKIYGAIAALSLSADTKKRAIKNGFFVLIQAGDNIKLLNEKVKSY